MRVLPLCCVIFIASLLCDYTLADSRTSPPSGAVVVRAGTTGEGEYSTITAALNSLPNDNSSCSIFIYPGTYKEQLFISRPGGLTIYGYTTRIETYTENVVIIQHNLSSAQAGSDDASGTLRIYKDNFAMYNVNVKNTHGFGSPAIAVSQYGNRVGFYACGLYGYQDTLLAEYGTQVYLQGYIEGAVDFIFGQTALAYFGGNTIAVSAAGFITASGRASDDLGSYVFNQNTIILASNAASNTGGNVYLGRPWRGYAKVIFKNTYISAPMNTSLWSDWNATVTYTDHVFLADYGTTGPGAAGLIRANFSTELSASQASMYTISSTVGSDYGTWVDHAYLI